MTYVDQFILANGYGCNVEDSAKWLIENMPDVWTKWVPANVAEKVKAGL
jgi:ABC-type proline/glycine betaine transport system substrate-binding protein